MGNDPEILARRVASLNNGNTLHESAVKEMANVYNHRVSDEPKNHHNLSACAHLVFNHNRLT